MLPAFYQKHHPLTSFYLVVTARPILGRTAATNAIEDLGSEPILLDTKLATSKSTANSTANGPIALSKARPEEIIC
jgi:hypothetical protein